MTLVLDACCSVKAMWYNKQDSRAVFMDIRKEDSGFLGYGRNEEISPDVVMDFRMMGYKDEMFKLVVLEPPHLLTLSKTSYFRKKFGCLNAETWQADLTMAFKECWRVLEDYGVLIFKWSDNEIPFKKVLKYAPTTPLFFNITNNKANSVTKWFCFMKIPLSFTPTGEPE